MKVKTLTTRPKSKPKLLKRKAVSPVNAVSRFIAREHLQSANIGWTGPNFQHLFLNKVEENIPAGKIAVHTLIKGSLDPEIMVELGRTKRVIFLADFFDLLKKQAKGQVDPLLTSGEANVAYCIANDGNIWAVNAYWNSFDRCWYVGAGSVGGRNGWGAGYLVLSQAV